MPKRIALPLVLLGFAVPGVFAGPEKSKLPTEFYERKKLSTTHEAFDRASASLEQVKAGMPELVFLEAMKMEVLARGKKPFDVRMDGYLTEASQQATERSHGRLHYIALGYVEDGHEVVKATVALRDHAVVEVSRAEDAVASATLATAPIDDAR